MWRSYSFCALFVDVAFPMVSFICFVHNAVLYASFVDYGSVFKLLCHNLCSMHWCFLSLVAVLDCCLCVVNAFFFSFCKFWFKTLVVCIQYLPFVFVNYRVMAFVAVLAFYCCCHVHLGVVNGVELWIFVPGGSDESIMSMWWQGTQHWLVIEKQRNFGGEFSTYLNFADPKIQVSDGLGLRTLWMFSPFLIWG